MWKHFLDNFGKFLNFFFVQKYGFSLLKKKQTKQKTNKQKQNKQTKTKTKKNTFWQLLKNASFKQKIWQFKYILCGIPL